MATVAVLGMGLLGIGFAENLLKKGHTVRVWNRTASKCEPVVQQGATAAESPAAAVAGVDRVHLILSEDRAVDAVIDALRPGLPDGVPIVDHSTNLPARVAERAAELRAAGIRYLHAPVFMAPANSKNATGAMLISGPAADIEPLMPALQQMTGRVLVLGEAPDKAAALKLVGNGMLVSLAGAMGDLFALAEATGLSDDDVMGLFEAFQPTPLAIGKRILATADGSRAPSFELSMARKDTRLMIESAGGPDGLDVLPGIARAMDAALDRGEGSNDYTIFAKLRR